MKIVRFSDGNALFLFEPPIEAGNHSVNTLADVAAVALTGPHVSPDVLALTAQQAQLTLDTAPDAHLEALNGMLNSIGHIVTAQYFLSTF